ncbi:hypothetical protein V490_01647 [Pseudogymnoascus sp. VKM F-3557]|nr:hypothetical protein V490_01647 [Pseudogymnoascus sp. VKM F-3557]
MTELAEIFDELDLAQYIDNFLEQGFDTWDAILGITEPDFDVLGVKLGHRRKLQRKIAATRGIKHDQALASPKRSSSGLDDKLLEGKGVTTSRSDGKDGSSSMQTSKKRKYRRHPKPDENAPARPRSAYVLFSNKMRGELKGRSLSFTEITKLVGQNWQNLTASGREPYEQQSFDAKERCRIELVEYEQTESYKAYSEYLLDFKAKQLPESSQELPNKTYKVLKLENIPNASSTSAAKHSPTLAGYRDTIIGANPQTLTWRDHARPTNIPIPGYSRQNEKNASQPGISNGPDKSLGPGLKFHNQRRVPESVTWNAYANFKSEPDRGAQASMQIRSLLNSNSLTPTHHTTHNSHNDHLNTPNRLIPPRLHRRRLPTSYNNTMLDYKRAQYQQFREAASSSNTNTTTEAAQPELGEPRSSSSTAGTAGSRESGSGLPGAARDFAQRGR